MSNAESIDLSQIPVAENDEQDIENITQKFQGKKNSEEIILQPLCKDILDLLIEKKKFNDTIKKFFVDLVLHTKLTLEQCSNDVNFLPVNFKNNCANGEIDIAILLESSKSEYLFKFPILIGELKTKIDEDTDYIQMLNYQLSVQRPYCVTAGRSHLLGFLMDFRNAYIFDFEVGYWTDPYPVPSTNQFFFIYLLELTFILNFILLQVTTLK